MCMPNEVSKWDEWFMNEYVEFEEVMLSASILSLDYGIQVDVMASIPLWCWFQWNPIEMLTQDMAGLSYTHTHWLYGDMLFPTASNE